MHILYLDVVLSGYKDYISCFTSAWLLVVGLQTCERGKDLKSMCCVVFVVLSILVHVSLSLCHPCLSLCVYLFVSYVLPNKADRDQEGVTYGFSRKRV